MRIPSLLIAFLSLLPGCIGLDGEIRLEAPPEGSTYSYVFENATLNWTYQGAEPGSLHFDLVGVQIPLLPALSDAVVLDLEDGNLHTAEGAIPWHALGIRFGDGGRRTWSLGDVNVETEWTPTANGTRVVHAFGDRIIGLEFAHAALMPERIVVIRGEGEDPSHMHWYVEEAQTLQLVDPTE